MMDSESCETAYRRVAETSEIPPGTGVKVVIDEDEIALFNAGGEFFALNNFCPHRGAPLCEGFLEDGKVLCPEHCFDFSLKTGESQIASPLRVATYPVKVKDGGVFILY